MIAHENIASPPPPRSERRPISFILMLGLLVVLVALGADVVPLAMRPLDYLGVPYPHAFRVMHLIMAALVFVVWFVFRRSGVATVVALFLAICVMATVTQWADAQLARIPLANWMEGTELRAAELRLGFKITESGNKDGSFLLVGRGNEQAATDEVKRLGSFRP